MWECNVLNPSKRFAAWQIQSRVTRSVPNHPQKPKAYNALKWQRSSMTPQLSFAERTLKVRSMTDDHLLGRSGRNRALPESRGITDTTFLDSRSDANFNLSDISIQDQSKGPGVPPVVTPKTTPPPTTSVDKIDFVDSATGATSGFPAITSGDLNAPGPWNSATTGGVSHSLQVHFNLDNGSSASLTPKREIQRSAWIAGSELKNPPDRPAPLGSKTPPTTGGFGGTIVGPDGPASHEIKKPSTSKIVVADAPGMASLSASQYPFVYKAHFTVTVSDSSKDIARIKYDVSISKTSATNVPNADNSGKVVSKEDLVRGKTL